MSADISPQQAHEWLSKGDALLVDVREPDEFKTAHIPYALSIPLGSVGDDFSLLNIPAGKKIIFQCRSGKRSQQACTVVKGKHNDREKNIYNMQGGILGWQDASLPLIEGAKGSAGITIFRQVQITVGALVALFVILGFAGLGFGFALAGLMGLALFMAGLTGWCGLAMLLARMPWNK